MRMPFQINSNGKDLLGIVHIANKQLDIPVIIIMCYGLNGNRCEQHRMSVKLGEMCEKHAINVVRFDYSDVGISEGDFFSSKLSDRIQNVIDIYNFIKGCFDNRLSVFLVGFSDGAKIAIKSKQYISDFKGLICWNPIIRVPIDANAKNNVSKIKLKLHKKYKKPYKQLFGVCLNMDIINELDRDNSIDVLDDNFDKLFVFGERDGFTYHIRQYIEGHLFQKLQIIIISDSGHLFGSTLWEKQVIECSVKWIKGVIVNLK